MSEERATYQAGPERARTVGRLKSYERGCSVPGCDDVHYGLGLCLLHYRRLHRHGSTDLPDRHKSPVACAVDGCAGSAVGRGLCMRHYQQERRRAAMAGAGARTS